MSRGKQQLYREDDAWSAVETIRMDRATAEADGSVVEAVLAPRPDVVIDMVCFAG